jgi:acyl dehydratase
MPGRRAAGHAARRVQNCGSEHLHEEHAMPARRPEDLLRLLGQEVGFSGWVEVTQAMIDRFADLTDDHQYIHVDPVRAAATPFGGTIAHGFLVLSLLPRMRADIDFQLSGARMGINYGFDRVRLMSPVHAGRRIRGRFVLKDLVERSPGQWLSTLTVTVEIEGRDKPAVVADWLGVQVVDATG